jgi:hypothetical protein
MGFERIDPHNRGCVADAALAAYIRIKTATSGNGDRAEKLGQQLFGRVHAMLKDVFEKEQGDVLEGLDMICQSMRDDKLPLFLPLLQSGEAKQRSRVMQVAAELGSSL